MWQVLSETREIDQSQRKLARAITESGQAQGPIDCEVGWPGGRHPINAYWLEDAVFWHAYVGPDLPTMRIKRHENLFGIAKPARGSPVKDFIQVNVPVSGIQRQIQGAFARDGDGRLYLVHRGRLAGRSQFLGKFKGRKVRIYDGEVSEAAFVAALESDQTIQQISDFVHQVYHTKSSAHREPPEKSPRTRPTPESKPGVASYREQVDRGLGILGKALFPYVGRELERDGRADENPSADPYALLRLMKNQWEIFDLRLGRKGRNCVYGLLDVRNSWAHHEPFSADDAHSALHTMTRLLQLIGADDGAGQVSRMRDELR